MSKPDPNVQPFSADVTRHHGYQYTGDRLSTRLANRRLTDVTLELIDLQGRRVVDVGCGDGTYTLELATLGGAARVHGIDPSEEAVGVARSKADVPEIAFAVSSAYALPFGDESFDVAHLRGVLHHMSDPVAALSEALRVAPAVVVVEPNGYNPGLKLLERYSKYHIEHGERSYAPRDLDAWVTQLGARIDQRRLAGFVPMFSPEWMAKAMKRLEPLVEGIPLVRSLGCAVYVFTAHRPSGLLRAGATMAR